MKLHLGFLGLLLATAAIAQTAPHAQPLDVLKGRPDAQGDELLGPTYESRASGVSFRPPAAAKQIKKSDGNVVAEFVVEPKNWRLTVVRTSVNDPLPLTADAPGQHGLLETTVEQFKQNNPNAQVVRQDAI